MLLGSGVADVGARYGVILYNPPPPGGGAEGDGGGGHATSVIPFLPLRLASASHLPLAWEDRNVVGDSIEACSTALPRRRPGSSWGMLPTERGGSLLRPCQLGPGLRRGGGKGAGTGGVWSPGLGP